VCGAGLAGMSAALELAERGYQVIIRENRQLVGGRLATGPVEVDLDGQRKNFSVEHGFHAWFHNYWTFKVCQL
jgi:carotenoid phi-ring synthase / carotenoid chi-ring synthase